MKISLPFKAKYEIAKVLLEDNPSKREDIVKWLIEKKGLKT